MKCTIPEISWHNRDPVLSIDIQTRNVESFKDDTFWRLATGGADSHVLIWHLRVNKTGGTTITCVADLERHQKAVNVVRFSPSAEILATGDDESAIILWKQKKDGSDPPPLDGEENLNEEQWNSWKVLRGHLEDIYDIAWSPDSKSLVSGSVDNSAIVWDVGKGRSLNILQDYKGFVQGVTWDPCNRYICTLSTDRHCRLVDVNSMRTIQRVHRSKIPTPPGHPLEGKTVRLFHDDTFKSFFRRLTFTIDGSLIIAPSGIIEPLESTGRISNATIIFARDNIKEPIIVLPSLEESTIAVRCCPVYFELRNEGPVSILALPYRMVFAVATQRSVLIYDTQQISPVAVVSNIHYTRLTDVAWSSDGRILVVSSTDGYCSIINFQEEELGKVYNPPHQQKQQQKQGQKEEILTKDEPKIVAKTTSPPRPSIKENEQLERSSDPMEVDIEESRTVSDTCVQINTADKKSIIEDSQDIKLVYTDTCDVDTTNNATRTTPPKASITEVFSRGAKTPRRVKLITLSSPKRPK